MEDAMWCVRIPPPWIIDEEKQREKERRDGELPLQIPLPDPRRQEDPIYKEDDRYVLSV